MNSINAMHDIAKLDLDAIKVKLMHQQSGEGWTAAHADAIEVEYRRFLCMMHMYPQEPIAPLVDVDTFWHYHILDTRKYAADCQQAFGYFLHHHPYVGLGEDDAADHPAFGARMHALYRATFGEACLSGAHATAWCSLNDGASARQTAWCSLDDKAGTARTGAEASGTAWCSATAKGLGTAWCSLGASAQTSAWCSAANSATLLAA
ncbi:glycine-rich domain-containing protein [Massilia sp. DWR3-1-1]|uniref:glycine-rich domain-containing protein n=1 Tax=Massilia sp. DWR3-1-1 TaxID=2804559 RepID=UPI003CF3DB7F